MTAPRILRARGAGPFVFFCDHASRTIPQELQALGLEAPDLTRHIAWDIGAAGVTAALSEIFDSPAILCGASRLVIDTNRQLHSPDLIVKTSDGTRIPGNLNLSNSDREMRIERWFRPYHDAVESVLLEREGRGLSSVAVSIHSMTAELHPANDPRTIVDGNGLRPWHIAISSHLDRRLADPVLAALRRSGDIVVGDNAPYNLDPDVDYSIPFHALRRNLLHLQVEFRQDEIADAVGQHRWALRLAQALT